MSYLDLMIERFSIGRSFEGADAEMLLDALITEQDQLRLTNVFNAWNAKGIDEDEIYEIAKILRVRMKRVNSNHGVFVDIVGTGGSNAKTFNVSTAAAFVTAATGLPVAKHGNKAATSNTGSADVLSELGVDPAVDPSIAEQCLNDIGICFMFAPNHHKLSPTLGHVRRGLGFPTIFNCVGPLCNPASAPYQLIGVWSKEMIPKIAGALARLGTKRSWVVCGEDGLDEISLSGITHVAEVKNGSISTFEIEPGYFGLQPSFENDLIAGEPAESAAIVRTALQGKANATAAEDLVLLNASAAIYIAGHECDPLIASELARGSLRNGNAYGKLNQLAAAIPK